jgi:hypothetical protein
MEYLGDDAPLIALQGPKAAEVRPAALLRADLRSRRGPGVVPPRKGRPLRQRACAARDVRGGGGGSSGGGVWSVCG